MGPRGGGSGGEEVSGRAVQSDRRALWDQLRGRERRHRRQRRGQVRCGSGRRVWAGADRCGQPRMDGLLTLESVGFVGVGAGHQPLAVVRGSLPFWCAGHGRSCSLPAAGPPDRVCAATGPRGCAGGCTGGRPGPTPCTLHRLLFSPQSRSCGHFSVLLAETWCVPARVSSVSRCPCAGLPVSELAVLPAPPAARAWGGGLFLSRGLLCMWSWSTSVRPFCSCPCPGS